MVLVLLLVQLAGCGGGEGEKSYTVTASAGAGGAISPATLIVPSGSTATFTVTPSEGFKIKSVSGCGGTLSGTAFTTGAVTAACAVNAEFVLDTPFATEAKLLEDLEPYYQRVCGDTGIGRSLQHVIPNDFDKDGRIDLLLNIWCSPVTSGTEYFGPTPNGAYVFKQDAAGNFFEKTAEIFGVPTVDLGGSGEYYVLEDFNEDGFKDVIYAVQREDGRRINNPPTAIYASNVALMSRGNGLYRTEAWGAVAWHSQLVLATNALGKFDVIETTFSQPSQGWRWQGVWTPVPGYDWVSSAGALFLTPTKVGQPSDIAISARSGDLVGVEARKLFGGSWVKSDEFGYPGSFIQKICCGNAGPSGAAFTQIDGKDYVDPSFGFYCEMRRTPGAELEAIVTFNANEIVGGYQGQIVVYGQTELIGTDKLFSFSVNSTGRLQRNTLTVRNEKTTNTFGNRMACMDLNADGFQDIVIYASKRDSAPLIYLNDGTGAFDRVKDAALPKYDGSGLPNYIIEDIDGDGIRDLVYFPIVGDKGRDIRVRIHKGLRQLNKSDVMPSSAA